jgi:UTP--glucose-1-phosphate uridylyltransferase
MRSVDPQTLAELAPYGFSEATLEGFAARVSVPSDNFVRGELLPPFPEDITCLPPRGSAERARLRGVGLEWLRSGKVGAVVLAGGMATRFGGVVKAVVPVLDGRSFLAHKIADLERVGQLADRPVPLIVLTSFATHTRIEAHLEELGSTLPIELCPQFVSLRLAPDGTLFREADGSLSPYAPGHGDLPSALRRSGALARFREGGGELLVMSNVDNLGATLDPAIIGLHVESGVALSAEVVRKEAGDKGGAPARLAGRPQIVEGFRFPPDFDQDRIPVFNTNTLVFSAEALDREFDLPYYRVEKKVEGRTAIQFERLVGELTAWLPSHFIEVDREGPDGRFLPAKDPEELARRLPSIAEVIAREP